MSYNRYDPPSSTKHGMTAGPASATCYKCRFITTLSLTCARCLLSAAASELSSWDRHDTMVHKA